MTAMDRGVVAPTALIAEDEPLLAKALVRELAGAWPALEIVAVADNGIAAIEDAKRLPDVMFLDIKMPGKSGIEVAEAVADEWPDDHPEPLFVFVTAYDEFAVSAFEHAAVDYLLKPATRERLDVTVARLQERLRVRAAAPRTGDMAAFVARMQSIAPAPDEPAEPIKVIRAGVGNTVRMIPVADVICFEATDKYVTVVSIGGEALVRMSMRELMTRIDTKDFKQIHRSVIVNSNHIVSATRDEIGHYTLNLRGMKRTLNVSRAFSYQFRPM